MPGEELSMFEPSVITNDDLGLGWCSGELSSAVVLLCCRVAELQRKLIEDFWRLLCNESIMVGETVSIVHYTKTRSNIKQSNPNFEAKLCYGLVNADPPPIL